MSRANQARTVAERQRYDRDGAPRQLDFDHPAFRRLEPAGAVDEAVRGLTRHEHGCSCHSCETARMGISMGLLEAAEIGVYNV